MRFWTSSEIQYLKTHYGIQDIHDIAQHLNRSEGSIKGKVCSLRIRKIKIKPQFITPRKYRHKYIVIGLCNKCIRGNKVARHFCPDCVEKIRSYNKERNKQSRDKRRESQRKLS